MITLVLKWQNQQQEITFPCSDEELQAKLSELCPIDPTPAEFFAVSVKEPSALFLMEEKYLNPDEVNYLAKRMESFDYKELRQFYAAAEQEGYASPANLINLTFNLQRYTLIQDLSNMESVGKTHYLNTHGVILEDERNRIDFATIGKELIYCGNGIATEYGLLFKNDEIPFHEVYNGKTFPEYYYDHCLVTATVEYNGNTEYLYLPCGDIAITKAIWRVGANSVDEPDICLTDINMNSPAWFGRLKQILHDGNIYDVNQVVDAIDTADMDLKKLEAVMEYAKQDSPAGIAAVANHMDYFIFLPGIEGDDEIAEHFINQRPEYALHSDMEDYFDFDGFGQHLAAEMDGRFVSSGFVCMAEDCYLENVLQGIEDQDLHIVSM